MSSINQNYKPRTNGFHLSSICNQQSCIFSKTYSKHFWITNNSLKKSANSTSLHKMCINNYIVYQSQTTSNFYFTFQ